MTIKRVEYRAVRPGRHLVVLGRIHGNEPCGAEGIEKVIRELDAGKLALTSGRLTLLPCCNPLAQKGDRRFVEKNLNRVFRRHERPGAYEEHLANLLIALIGKPDFVLDLHSFHVGGRGSATYAMRADPARLVGRVCKRLAVDYCLNHWLEVQAAFGRRESFSTIDHAKSMGIAAIGVECGQHESPGSRNVAYQCIRTTMDELGICRVTSKRTHKTARNVFFKYLKVYEKGARFIRAWKDFDRVEKDEPIGRLANGQIVRAPVAGNIIFPHPGAHVGDEWFYIAQ